MKYADIIHRLSLGETVTGAELLALPGSIPDDPPIDPETDYLLGDLPLLFPFVATLAANLEGEDSEEALQRSCDLHPFIGAECYRGKPLPQRVRAMMWNIAQTVDLAAQLAGA